MDKEPTNSNANSTALMHKRVFKLVLLAILAAVIVVLQYFGAALKVGPFNLTFTLIPVVLGAAILGIPEGAGLGFLFGLITLINCINGADIGGAMMFAANPFATSFVCLFKGTMAGLVPAIICKALEKRETLGVILASLSAPVVNTGIFCIFLPIFFMDIFKQWAAGTNLFIYMFTGLIGINFLIEFLVNALLATTLAFVVNVIKHKMKLG
ncbi:MAG: ECF transporter S component [Clostridia bacterium]|nr:ECF transporter S component [Clostridia bacterium]